jgi:hypothetical protein
VQAPREHAEQDDAGSTMIGDWTPTKATMKPSVAARLYAGAVDATPMTTLETSPSAPDLSPLPLPPSLLGRIAAVRRGRHLRS